MSKSRITLKEVAERAGVSRSAVSRTFTAGASVSQETRRVVTKAAQELGYRPNLLASSLTTGKTKLIGIVTESFVNPVFLEIFEAYTKGLQSRDYHPLIVNLSGETDPSASVNLLRQYSAEGVIVASSSLPASFTQAFQRAGFPVVHAFGRHAGQTAANVVGVDNVRAGALAAQCLIDRGYRRLGFLGGPETSTSTIDRLSGFITTAQSSAGVTVTVSHAASYSYGAGRAGMAALIDRGILAESYFCGDDVVAIGAMDALSAQGLRVPQDVGIIGMNDMPIAAWNCVGLTTIHQPIAQIVAASIELLIATIQDPGRKAEVRLLPCHLVLRHTLC